MKKMVESFLILFARLAGVFRLLMPAAIRLSMVYLRRKYRLAFLVNDPSARAEALRHLAVLRQKVHPPAETCLVDVRVDDDIPMKMNVCQQYCGDIYYGVGFEQGEVLFVKNIVGAGDVFFDIGANVGVYTLLASRLVGGNGRVHAFEPLADAFALLKKNVESNRAGNISLNSAAVGEAVGEMDLYVNTQAALTGLGRTNRGTLLGVQKTPVWTLDHYARQSNVREANFLKIDVEGFEGHVLRGAADLLSASPDLVVMSELAQKNFEPLGFSVKEVVDWMQGLGFEAWMIRNDGLKLERVTAGSSHYPFQNFVFARRENKKYALLESLEADMEYAPG
jgi:FkbM family methyltransferase